MKYILKGTNVRCYIKSSKGILKEFKERRISTREITDIFFLTCVSGTEQTIN